MVLDTNKIPQFHKDWNSIMFFVRILEESTIAPPYFSMSTTKNFCKFYNGETCEDYTKSKGVDLLEAINNCCYQLLIEFDTNNKLMDKIEVENRFNDEGFNEADVKEFFKTLTTDKLESLYKVSLVQNPHLTKFIIWIKAEVEKRK